NVQDTFYHATPLLWALTKGHLDVVQALVEAGASGADSALSLAAARGHVELVRTILNKIKPKEAVLSKALAATPATHTAITDLLRKAGAKLPAAKPELTVDRDTLLGYVGTYRKDDLELKIAVKDGTITA